MLKIPYADYLRLSPAISAQFTLGMCVAARNRQKSLKPFILKVQCHSRSSMLTLLGSLPPVLVMISSMYVPICNHITLDKPTAVK